MKCEGPSNQTVMSITSIINDGQIWTNNRRRDKQLRPHCDRHWFTLYILGVTYQIDFEMRSMFSKY